MRRRPRLSLRFWLKAAFLSVMGVLALCVVLLAALAWDARLAYRELTGVGLGKTFERRGGVYAAVHPQMIASTFSVEKAPDEFRVFILGSSVAMGTPYVYQDREAPWQRLLGIPNEGGIATWLPRYLQRLLPGKRVVVVNAAKGGGRLSDSLATMREVAEFGRPDAVILLDGNNERDLKALDLATMTLRPGVSFDEVLSRSTRDFAAVLAEFRRLSARAKAPLYVLTVPDNLRDWRPDDGPDAGRSLRPEARATYWFFRGQALEDRGELSKAREAFVRAKDLDRSFWRVRTPWNDAIRALRGPYVRVVDLERLIGARAPDGIPGYELFHDHCHLNLAGYRYAAFALADRMAADFGWAGRPALDEADLGAFAAVQRRRLYRIKALTWARSGWLGRLNPIQASNAEAARQAYLAQARDIDDLLHAYR